MTLELQEIDPAVLAEVVAQYPDLGAFRRIVRNGLSVNTPTCVFATEQGQYFAKAPDPDLRELAMLTTEHAIIRHLNAAGYPTPKLHANACGETISWHKARPYAIFDLARGEDRYRLASVFAPYGSSDEANTAGAHLAMFHQALQDFPLPDPKPMQGITARYELMRAPSVQAGLEALLQHAFPLRPFLASRPELATMLTFLEGVRERLQPCLPHMPRGIIHGDFIKRNLCWDGVRIVDVLDFDLWNVGFWVYDLALALLPSGFNWPDLFAGKGEPRAEDLQAFLGGYHAVRPLTAAEEEALPLIMETARFEFYLSVIASALIKGDQAQAERFWELQVETMRWFVAHPDWRQIIPSPLSAGGSVPAL